MKLPLVILRKPILIKFKSKEFKKKKINFYLGKMAAPVLDIKLNIKASDMEEDSIVKINIY